eukprot:3190179-Pleurochrysis_carterae.AAC.2
MSRAMAGVHCQVQSVSIVNGSTLSGPLNFSAEKPMAVGPCRRGRGEFCLKVISTQRHADVRRSSTQSLKHTVQIF